MHPALIALIVMAAWALGPMILRWVGGFFAIGALLVIVFGSGNENQISLLIAGTLGALMWIIGASWQLGREEGRGPLIWSLLVDHIPALHQRRNRRDFHYAGHWQETWEPDTTTELPERSPQKRRRRRWRITRRRPQEPNGQRSGSSTTATRERDQTARTRNETATEDTAGRIIDGVAHDLSRSPDEDEALRKQGLREDLDQALEEAHRYLEPLVYELFVLNGAGWFDRLSAARRARRRDPPPLDAQQPFHDRRTLFSVIAYDWTLIGSHFMRDPSEAGRALCAIANRHAHEGPRQDDPAAARQAFGEICAALRPQSVNRVLNPTKPWLW